MFGIHSPWYSVSVLNSALLFHSRKLNSAQQRASYVSFSISQKKPELAEIRFFAFTALIAAVMAAPSDNVARSDDICSGGLYSSLSAAFSSAAA